MKTWSDGLASCEKDFQLFGIAEAWIIGPCAKGLPVPKDGALTIAVRYLPVSKGDSADDEPAFEMLRDYHLPMVLSAVLRESVHLVQWTGPDRPADGFEIIFQ